MSMTASKYLLSAAIVLKRRIAGLNKVDIDMGEGLCFGIYNVLSAIAPDELIHPAELLFAQLVKTGQNIRAG
jgi:hypothetical protein